MQKSIKINYRKRKQSVGSFCSGAGGLDLESCIWLAGPVALSLSPAINMLKCSLKNSQNIFAEWQRQWHAERKRRVATRGNVLNGKEYDMSKEPVEWPCIEMS